MDVRLEQRSDRAEPVACAYCRGPLDDDSRAGAPCAGCGVVLHGECLALNAGRCTTVGCTPPGVSRWRERLARAVDSGWVWAAVTPAVAVEALVGAAGGWLHVGLTALVLGLVLRRAARGAWTIDRARVAGATLLGFVLVALDLRELRLGGEVFDAYLLCPVLTVLALLSLIVGTHLLTGRAAAAKTAGKDEPADAPRQAAAVCVAITLIAASCWRAVDSGAQWVADARAAWNTRGDVDDLREVLLDHSRWDDAVRSAAERALGRLDRADLNRPLMRTLAREGDEYLRRSAAIALGLNAAKDPTLVPELVSWLDAEESELARGGLVVALHRYAEAYPLATRVALPALVRALQDDDTWTRINAIQALVALGDPAAVPHLARLLVRRAADDRIGGDYRRPDLLVARELPKFGEPGRAALREAARARPELEAR